MGFKFFYSFQESQFLYASVFSNKCKRITQLVNLYKSFSKRLGAFPFCTDILPYFLALFTKFFVLVTNSPILFCIEG